LGPRSPCDSRRRRRRQWRQHQHQHRRTREGFSPAVCRRVFLRRRRRQQSLHRPTHSRVWGVCARARRAEEGRGRRCRRCYRRCQVASEGEAAAATANMFSERIVTADYYMASPLQGLDICQSPLTQVPVKKVPVVRVFGATPAGKRGAGREREPAGRPGRSPRRAHARTPPAPALFRGSRSRLPSSPPSSPFSPARDKRRRNGGGGPRECGGVSFLSSPHPSRECVHCARRGRSRAACRVTGAGLHGSRAMSPGAGSRGRSRQGPGLPLASGNGFES
jgi:hypothetical protein